MCHTQVLFHSYKDTNKAKSSNQATRKIEVCANQRSKTHQVETMRRRQCNQFNTAVTQVPTITCIRFLKLSFQDPRQHALSSQQVVGRVQCVREDKISLKRIFPSQQVQVSRQHSAIISFTFTLRTRATSFMLPMPCPYGIKSKYCLKQRHLNQDYLIIR